MNEDSDVQRQRHQEPAAELARAGDPADDHSRYLEAAAGGHIDRGLPDRRAQQGASNALFSVVPRATPGHHLGRSRASWMLR
jgi:hypothetical protein